MDHCDVLIVGGAAVGSAAAFFLAAHPQFDGRLLVLDQDFSYQRCATTLSVASVRHQFSTPENIRMSMFGSEFIARLGEHLVVDGEVPDVAWHEGGYLFLASPAGLDTLQANHRTQRELGAMVQLLDPEALRRRFPWLHCDDLAGASLGLRGEGWLDAYALMMALRRKAVSLGAEYRQAQVTGLQRSGRRVLAVSLADGTRIGCGTLINAAGTGAAALARSAGIDLPVQPRKRCVFHVRSPAHTPGCPLVIDPSGVYFRPEGTGWLCGVAPPEDLDPPCEDFEVQHALFDDLLWPVLAARVPGFEALRVQRAWAGHYDVNLLDHNMILGPHPDIDNLLFANGFSGHGLQHAPAVGRALSELVVHGGYRSLDLSRLGWARVLRQQPLYELNVV
ncbi:MAG: FAD-binding oxidoreductase [Burkholderiaceae bacterium]|jgi:glycine/D-amino acid oxidase-like deaminating enzyme|nr:FAD-binding oxidoreductase [Burkholderiaceae bacterium]